MNTLLAEQMLPSGQTIQVVQGDITAEDVDAIVNAANEYLQHGGGVARSISQKGGSVIQNESNAWVEQHGQVPHAHPAWTLGGRLPAKYVIHAVGPVWGGGDEDNKLEAAVSGSLRVADELKCSSLAMPAISTGIYGFPKERAAGIIFSAVESYFADNSSSGLKTVKLVLYDQPTVDVFLQGWHEKWDGSR
ncbi:MAG TPA: macro domain-containing protein [Anaerolineales bacterium]